MFGPTQYDKVTKVALLKILLSIGISISLFHRIVVAQTLTQDWVSMRPQHLVPTYRFQHLRDPFEAINGETNGLNQACVQDASALNTINSSLDEWSLIGVFQIKTILRAVVQVPATGLVTVVEGQSIAATELMVSHIGLNQITLVSTNPASSSCRQAVMLTL